ncbi:unnamed protein product [Ectocarpus sp. 6 AP-2014]
MKCATAFALMVASANAFVPSAPLPTVTSRTSSSSLQMIGGFGRKKAAAAPAPPARPVSTNAVDGLVGADIETGGPFDPLGFGKNCPPEQMQWYRAAELKHGRVCMLAAFGQITQHFTHWNDPSGIFDKSGSAWGAMQQVYEQRPLAFVQIFLAIFAVEVYGNRKQEENEAGGDLGFDPLGLKPSNPESWERVQLRELKNGRLAMFAILGMIVQEHITGVGVLEKVDALAGLA